MLVLRARADVARVVATSAGTMVLDLGACPPPSAADVARNPGSRGMTSRLVIINASLHATFVRQTLIAQKWSDDRPCS